MTKLSEKKGGGLIYNPPRMLFDGSTGYYSASYTSSGNKVSVRCEFRFAAFSGGGFKRIMTARGSGGVPRVAIQLFATDYSDADLAGRLSVGSFNTGAAPICFLVTPDSIDPGDNELHRLAFAFDADAGTAVFVIDGQNADDTGNADRTAPTTGALQSSAGSAIGFGADSDASEKMPGEIGAAGYDDGYHPNWSEYMDTRGNLRQFDFSGWKFGHFAGKLDENEGTAGAMTKNGTITLVDPGPCPHIGLPTIGDAVAADIASGKIAWVNGVEIVGTAV